MKYLYLFFVLNEIKSLKENDIINLYNLLQSKKMFLGIPIDYGKQNNQLVIQLNIDLSKIKLSSYQNMSNVEFLNEVENSIKNICNILEYLQEAKIIYKIADDISLKEIQQNGICDKSMTEIKYVNFFESKYKLTNAGHNFIKNLPNNFIPNNK